MRERRLSINGKRFGRLRVIELSHTTNYGKSMWKCRCDCGREKIVMGSHLTSGATQSCGCLGKEKRAMRNSTHGDRNSKIYGVWASMKQRCSLPSHKQYKDYGGRGITVCEEWKNSFENFRDWATVNGYSEGLTLERKDTDGNYCPENCKWASRVEQNRNKRNTIHIEISSGAKPLSELAEESGIPYTTLYGRYKRGLRGESLIRKDDSYL